MNILSQLDQIIRFETYINCRFHGKELDRLQQGIASFPRTDQMELGTGYIG